MYLLCINKGNTINNYTTPEVGIVYKGSKINSSKCKCGLCGGNLYYHIPSLGYSTMHSQCLFEVLPDDILTNIKTETKLKTQDHGIKLENYTTP